MLKSLRPCLDHKGQKCPWGESANGKVQDKLTVPKANPKGKRGPLGDRGNGKVQKSY